MAKKLRLVLLAMLFLLITLSYPCWSELISNIKSLVKVPHEVQRVQLPTFHDNPLISSDGCEQTYGVMPCTNTVLGNGFLILVYAYCIFWAAKILTDGSEILLEIVGPGIFGGLFLLTFSSLPNAIIVLASGLSETKETAQSQLSIGMGLLAGTAVNLLTLLSGSSVLFSRHDLEDSADSTNTKRFSFTVLMLLLGILVASFFADPLVDVVDNFAIATRIPSFFISFIILPFAGCSDVVSALLLVSRKKPGIVGKLTFSEIYRLVTVSNSIGLSVFLSLIYIRNLEWYFSIEMLTIVIVCTAIGLLASFRTTFPPWMCAVAYTLYPFSLVLVNVLDSVLGLS